MNERVLLDAGPLVAWLDGEDQWHSVAVNLSRGFRPPFLTCEPVVTEVCFLLQRLPRAIEQIGKWMENGHLKVAFALGGDYERVFELMEKYRDLPMSLAYACLVRMIEAGIGDRVLTLDHHFRVYRHSGRRVVPVRMP